jgi:hypothetical protein
MKMDKHLKTLNEMSDEENPKMMFQGMSVKLLIGMATGKLNATEYAKFELQNMGLGKNGKWVGFPESEKIWKSKIK